MHGLKDSIANPEEAAKILNKHHREIDVDIGTAEVKAVAGLVRKDKPGMIDLPRMQRTVDIVSEAFALKQPVKAVDVYATGFVQ